MAFDETNFTDHRDGTAKLETVSKAASVDGNARIWALIMAKCWGKKLQGGTDMIGKILEIGYSQRETDTYGTQGMLLENITPILYRHS